MYIFAGDVGGTHTRLCICKSIENGDEICAEHIFHSREYDSFYEILDQLDDDAGLADGYSIGVEASLNLFDGGAAKARARQANALVPAC